MAFFRSLLSFALTVSTALSTPVARQNSYEGVMTYYYPDTGKEGACGQYYETGDSVVAISASIYGKFADPNNTGFCGQWIWINFNSQKTRARIFDKCDGCDATHIDVSPNVFQHLSPLDPGHVQVQWGFESADNTIDMTTHGSHPPVPAAETAPSSPGLTTQEATVPSATTYDALGYNNGFYTPKVYADGVY